MTIEMRCQDKDRLIGYLYSEDDPQERAAVEAHTAICSACALEIEELRATRARLAEWREPESELGFRIVREPLARPGRGRWTPPWWAALPAAAALVLALGAAIANLEVRYGADGVVVRSGWTRVPPAQVASQPIGAPAASPAAAPADVAWRQALADTERRLRQEFAEASSRAMPAAAAGASGANGRMDPSQVRALIEASERRQQRELALRIAEVMQDIEAQRRADLVQIDENLEHIEGLTAARQREVMSYLVRVSEGR